MPWRKCLNSGKTVKKSHLKSQKVLKVNSAYSASFQAIMILLTQNITVTQMIFTAWGLFDLKICSKPYWETSLKVKL